MKLIYTNISNVFEAEDQIANVLTNLKQSWAKRKEDWRIQVRVYP